MRKKSVMDNILECVRACDAVQLATINKSGYPEVRDIANMLNQDADSLPLYFMTTRHTPKVAQIINNPKCSIYCYDVNTHHAMRLFGRIKVIDTRAARHEFWRDRFYDFGLNGPDDAEFVLLRFNPTKYKFYIGNEEQSGRVPK